MPHDTWTWRTCPVVPSVTGASSGLGLVTARRLAGAGARVVLAVRNLDKGRTAAATMTGTIEVRPLDLGNLASVRAFAGEWTGPLDILINDAGIMQVPYGTTVDGFELPYVTDRVVTVSSEMHKKAYRNTKLANLLFTFELQRRLARTGSGVRAMAAHPGIARTGLADHVTGLKGLGLKVLAAFARDAEGGAPPTLYAATYELPGGSYIGPDGPGERRGYPTLVQASATARDTDLGRRLWEASASLTGVG